MGILTKPVFGGPSDFSCYGNRPVSFSGTPFQTYRPVRANPDTMAADSTVVAGPDTTTDSEPDSTEVAPRRRKKGRGTRGGVVYVLPLLAKKVWLPVVR